MRRLPLALAILALGAVAYLLLWPVPIRPVAWTAPPRPGYVGVHAPNTRLADLRRLSLGGEVGPEHVVWRDGWVYASVAGGAILKLRPDGSGRTVVARTGGRPLGFAFAPDGALIVADPVAGEHGGLLRVVGEGAGARVHLLADAVQGDPIVFADAVVVASSGRIYFSDASRRFGARTWGGPGPASVLDVLEHSCTGRLLEHDPAARRTRGLLSDLCFANGVALSSDERHLFLAETGAYRIWKVDVAAAGLSARRPTPQARVLLDNLPGMPDNLQRGRDGRIWAGLAAPRSAAIDNTAGRPWLRSLVLRLPPFLRPAPRPYGHVFAFDERGRVVADLQDPSGSHGATGLTEAPGRLYVHSLDSGYLGWLDGGAAGPAR